MNGNGYVQNIMNSFFILLHLDYFELCIVTTLLGVNIVCISNVKILLYFTVISEMNQK